MLKGEVSYYGPQLPHIDFSEVIKHAINITLKEWGVDSGSGKEMVSGGAVS